MGNGYIKKAIDIKYNKDSIEVNANILNKEKEYNLRKKFTTKNVDLYKFDKDLNFSKYSWLFAYNRKELGTLNVEMSHSENAANLTLNKEIRFKSNYIKIVDVAYSDCSNNKFLKLKIVGNVFNENVDEIIFVDGIKGVTKLENFHVGTLLEEDDKTYLIKNNININTFSDNIEKYLSNVKLYTQDKVIDLKDNNNYDFSFKKIKIGGNKVETRVEIVQKFFAKEFNKSKEVISTESQTILGDCIDYYTVDDVLDVLLAEIKTLNRDDSHFPSYYVSAFNNSAPDIYRSQFFDNVNVNINDLTKGKNVVIIVGSISGDDKLGEITIDAGLGIIDDGKYVATSNSARKFKINNLPKFSDSAFDKYLQVAHDINKFDSIYKNSFIKFIKENKNLINENGYILSKDEIANIYKKQYDDLTFAYNFENPDVIANLQKSYIKIFINGSVISEKLNNKTRAILYSNTDKLISVDHLEIKYTDLKIKDITTDGDVNDSYQIEQNLKIKIYFAGLGEKIFDRTVISFVKLSK